MESLASVLDSAPFNFSLELAAIAHQKNMLDLEAWLTEKISNSGIPFLHAMITFINTRLMSGSQSNGVSTSSILSFFPLLKASLARLPQEIPQEVISQISLMEVKAIELQQQQTQQLKVLHGFGPCLLLYCTLSLYMLCFVALCQYKRIDLHVSGDYHYDCYLFLVCCRIFDFASFGEVRFISFMPFVCFQAAQTDQSEQYQGFESDIESEANAHFQKIHSEETQLSEVIRMLKAYHDSPDQREQEVFACMVHNLFEKYRSFGRYSEAELNTTAILMGQLIHHKLVREWIFCITGKKFPNKHLI